MQNFPFQGFYCKHEQTQKVGPSSSPSEQSRISLHRFLLKEWKEDWQSLRKKGKKGKQFFWEERGGQRTAKKFLFFAGRGESSEEWWTDSEWWSITNRLADGEGRERQKRPTHPPFFHGKVRVVDPRLALSPFPMGPLTLSLLFFGSIYSAGWFNHQSTISLFSFPPPS